MAPIIDPHHSDQKARQIRSQVTTVLMKWRLLPRFKRWRLTQDPDSGLVVLFAILNMRYIATHTSIPFSDYFDPRVLHDLANELHVEVVSCNGDGPRYAFILSRGEIDTLPTHVDIPYLEGNRLVVRVVYDDIAVPETLKPQFTPAPLIAAGRLDDQTLVDRGVGAFLKVFDDIKLREAAAARLASQLTPEIVLIDKDEFNKRLAEYEATRS